MNKLTHAIRVFLTTLVFCAVVIPLVLVMLSFLAGEAQVQYAVYGSLLGGILGAFLGMIFGILSLLSPQRDQSSSSVARQSLEADSSSATA